MDKVFKKLARSDKTILITGETGTGKSRAAKQASLLSRRAHLPFIHVNLCNFATSVFESELFGHSRGAFTGAVSDRPGFLATVGRGTLFLDELGDLPLETQSKLLMLLEEGIYYPVGSSKPQTFQGRLIFATNKNLSAMVGAGEFREDLYQRVKTFEIRLKPLRSRPGLIEAIEDELLAARKHLGNENIIISEEALRFLSSYTWPGNYRELKQVMEYAVLISDGIITMESLPAYLTKEESSTLASGDYWSAIEGFEKKFLANALEKRAFRINKTAREIGISKVTLLSKIKKYDIKDRNKKLSFEAAG